MTIRSARGTGALERVSVGRRRSGVVPTVSGPPKPLPREVGLPSPVQALRGEVRRLSEIIDGLRRRVQDLEEKR